MGGAGGLHPRVQVMSRKIPCNASLSLTVQKQDTENSISWARERFWLLCFLCWNCLSGHIPSAISSDCNKEGQLTVTQSPYVRKYEKLSDQKCVCTVHPQFYFKIECFLHSWLLTYVIWPTKTEQCDLKHCKRISFDILATLSEEIALIYETYSKIFVCIFCNFLSQIYRRKFHKEL